MLYGDIRYKFVYVNKVSISEFNSSRHGGASGWLHMVTYHTSTYLAISHGVTSSMRFHKSDDI